MVLHRTRQHGSMSFFHSAKQLSKCSFISPSFLFFAAAAQRNRILNFTGYRISFRPLGQIQCFLLCLINFHSQQVKLCGRTNHTVLRRAALSGPEGRRPVLDGGYLASRLLKHWSPTFDRVTNSLIFNMDCVSNGLGRN